MQQTPGDISLLFREFAGSVCRGASPLYEDFATRLSADAELLSIAAQIRAGQPANLFFAAVHYLLLKGADHSLARHYPSVCRARSGWAGQLGQEAPPSLSRRTARGPDALQPGAYSDFRSFCLEYREPIVELISGGSVQTNEVGRYACMLPALLLAAEKSHPMPVALIEIGASAGLGLIWDLYHYRFDLIHNGTSVSGGPCPGRLTSDSSEFVEGAVGEIDSAPILCWGDRRSPVQIRTELRGAYPSFLPSGNALIGERVGVDLQPIDLGDPDRVLWLRSFIFPEQTERDERLQSAARLAIKHGVTQMLTQGDAVEVVPDLLHGISKDIVPCVFNSFALSQIPPERRGALLEAIAQEGARRTVFHVSLEWLDTTSPLLSLTEYDGGRRAGPTILARCDPHGRWLDAFATLAFTSSR